MTYIWKEAKGIGDYLVGYPGVLREFGRRRGWEFLGTDPQCGSTGGYLTPDFAPQPQLLSIPVLNWKAPFGSSLAVLRLACLQYSTHLFCKKRLVKLSVSVLITVSSSSLSSFFVQSG